MINKAELIETLRRCKIALKAVLEEEYAKKGEVAEARDTDTLIIPTTPSTVEGAIWLEVEEEEDEQE